MKAFITGAKGLASNPLGIIALFISLIYGFACLVVVGGSTNLTDDLLTVLVWFLVLFPCLILVSFLFLVVFHHQKLYAPSDYRDESNFFVSMSTEKRKKKLEEEFEDSVNVNNEDETSTVRKDIKIEKPDNAGFKMHAPEVMIQDKKDYALFEELAIKKLESEYNTTINRHVQMYIGNNVLEVDGLFYVKNRTNLIEVKYAKGNRISLATLKRIESNLPIIHSIEGSRYKYIVVIMHHEGFGNEIRKQIETRYKDEDCIQFRFYNIEKLQEEML